MRSYLRPKTSEEFEHVCTEYLRRAWGRPGLVRYGKSGEDQHGVDLVDLGTPDDCWAAQCKLHEEEKTLQAAEIKAEVEKTDGFPHTIRRYAVCTTGRKTKHAQDAVLELNETRKAAGKFLVELIYWEDIELLLESDDHFREQYHVSSHSSVRGIVRAETEHAIAPVRARLDDVLGGLEAIGATAIDTELDRAKNLFDSRKQAAAEELLRDLHDKKYDRMTPLQRFRCLSNLGVIEVEHGNDEEGGRLILKATDEYPSHEKAITNRAHALSLLGRHAEAWEAIQRAREARPHDTAVAAAFVAYAPSAVSADELRTQVESLAAEPLVLLAFARRCVESGDHVQALSLIGRLKELDHESADSLLLEAHAVAGPHLPRDPRDRDQDGAARQRVVAALELFGRAAERAEEDGEPRLAMRALLAQADVAGHIDDRETVARSLEEAGRLATGHSRALVTINIMRSQAALAAGQAGRALEYADRALQHGEDVNAATFRAVALLNRNEGMDRENGRRELRRLLPRLQGPYLEQAANILITDQLGERRHDNALDTVGAARSAGLDTAHAFAQEARIANARADSASAVAIAQRAVAALSDSSSLTTRRMVADLLRQCRELELAIEVLRPVASKKALTDETRLLLALAMQAKRDDLVLEWCKALWVHDALDAQARWSFLYLLDNYDPREALGFTLDAIAKERDPDELSALKARRSLAQRRLAVTIDPINEADLPPVETVPLNYVALFVEALISAGLYSQAVEYAYRSVLRFPDEPSVHAALIRSFLLARGDAPLASAPSEVRVGCTVQLQEADDPPVAHTIETSRAPGLRDVIAVTDPLAVLLLGRRVGDSVVLAEGATGLRTATVKSIEPAAVFRFNDSMNTWQIRFPDHPMLEQSRFKTDPATGELDMSPLIEFLKRQVENVKRIDAAYRGGAMPISFMAERAGRNLFQTMAHLAFDDDLFVNCVLADDAAFRNALALLDGAKGVILDGTAAWTLQQLGLSDLLVRFPLTVGTVQQTLDEIQEEATGEKPGRERGALSLVDDKAIIHEILPEMRERHRSSWQEVAAALNGHAYSSEELALLPTKRREELLSFAGPWAAHAMAAAKENGFLLWSDDRVIEFLAKEYFGVERVWTQAVLHWLRARGLLDDTRLRRASAELQARRYSGTFTDAEVLVQAARLADWQLAHPVFERNLRPLESPATDLRVSGAMALALISACMIDVRLARTRTLIVSAVLERLRTRDRSLRVVQYVLRALPVVMRLNPIGAQRATAIVWTWLQTNSGLVVRGLLS